MTQVSSLPSSTADVNDTYNNKRLPKGIHVVGTDEKSVPKVEGMSKSEDTETPWGRVFKIALKSCAFFTYSIDALDHQIWRKVFIRPFLNVTVSSFL